MKFFLPFLILISLSVQADPSPGDACTVANARMISGGPELTGVLHQMICSGGVWVATMSFLANNSVGISDATPQSALQVLGYLQLDIVSAVPAAGDCDTAAEYGRMKVHSAAGNSSIHICTAAGWKTLGEPGLATCPTNWTLVGTAGKRGSFCIENDERAAAIYLTAKSTCTGLSLAEGQAELCYHNEWYKACSAGGLTNITGNWEWTASGNDQPARVGNASCASVNFGAFTDSYNYRCCIR